MKRITFLLLALATVLIISGCATTGLDSFGAEMGKQDNPIPGMDAVRIPYTSTVKYFGYVQPGEEPDELIDGKKIYYLYVWIPAIVPELGIRMLSPVGDQVLPEDGDIVAANYEAGVESDADAYFDTWINFERAVSVLSPEDISAKASSSEWISLSQNDDSGEMPAQPSGSSYNSLMRIEAGDNPLVRGLYRIAFTTYKTGEVQGSFYAEVGTPIELPGVVIAKTLAEITEALK